MIEYINPFEYEAANKFGPEQIVDFYVEDFNYSRFIHSRRNIFLIGERGTGKTMTLLYNSLAVQIEKERRLGNEYNFDVVCVYIPCNTPLIYKLEYQLLEKFQASVVSEHFLVLTIMYAIVDSLSKVKNLVEGVGEEILKSEIKFVLGMEFPKDYSFLEGLRLAIQSEAVKSQREINNREPDAFYNDSISFSSGILPLLSILRKMPKLQDSHFALMFDDAHDLNEHQIKALNSWIAYRDNTLFSFKVATVKVNRPHQITASGGNILEGHDFTLIDLEQPYQNEYSSFGKMARHIIERRLQKVGINVSSDIFFPTSPQFKKDMYKCEEKIKKEAMEKFPAGTKKQINDYVYKFTRAEYFRRRSSRANLPIYSGFDTIVHISTGVIRNLLEPCYWMYDAEYSEQHSRDIIRPIIKNISHSLQNEIILDRSKRKWEWIRSSLDKSIEGCSSQQAKSVYQLFDKLADLFKERLLRHKSEPRAIKFTISEINFPNYDDLMELLNIAHKAQILYTYTSSGKESGSRKIYYVPNRILWPFKGLDPHGQHAAVSIKASILWDAATRNKKMAYDEDEEIIQKELFNNEK